MHQCSALVASTVSSYWLLVLALDVGAVLCIYEQIPTYILVPLFSLSTDGSILNSVLCTLLLPVNN